MPLYTKKYVDEKLIEIHVFVLHRSPDLCWLAWIVTLEAIRPSCTLISDIYRTQKLRIPNLIGPNKDLGTGDR